MSCPTLEEGLERGLAWLFTTEHPEGATVSHLGASLLCDGNRRLGFCPAGSQGRPTITLEVAHPQPRRTPRWGEVSHVPLAPDELDRLSALLAARGYEEDHRWNGFPATTGSVAVAQELHPSMRAALERYRAGCRVHHGSVFCGCATWAAGYGRLAALHTLRPVR